MCGSRHPALAVASAALLLFACSSTTSPLGPADAGGGGPAGDGGRTADASDAPRGACRSCTDGGRDAPADGTAPPKDASLSDASLLDASKPPRDAAATPASLDAASDAVDAAEDAGRLPPGYPAGHHGTQVGDTLPFLRWEGYVAERLDGGLVSDGPLASYSSDDMRRSGKSLALLHVADFDCPGCNHAATVLAAGAHDLQERGALVVEVLGSSEFTNPADRAHLDAWVTTYELSFTSVIDAPGHELATLNAVGIRETALVIELTTMQVMFRATGNLAQDGPTSLDTALTYASDHLAP